MAVDSLAKSVATHIAEGVGGATVTANAGRDIDTAVKDKNITPTSAAAASASAVSAALSFTPLSGAASAAGLLSSTLSIYSDTDSNGYVSDRTIIGTLGSLAGAASLMVATPAAVAAFTAASIGLGIYALTIASDSQEVSSAVSDLFDALGDLYRRNGSTIPPSEFGDAVASPAIWSWEDFSRGYGDTGYSCIPLLNNGFDTAEETVSPLILDLDGDGVETLSVNSGIHFDHDSNGFAETTGWVGKDDGLLVWDRNGNGNIDSGRELFGNYTNLVGGNKASNGFVALAELDTNHDGRVDSSDADFSQLRVWKDANSNGKVDDGELLTLAEAKVKSLEVNYTTDEYKDAQGNEVRQVGGYIGSDGAAHAMSDIWFDVDTARTVDLKKIVLAGGSGDSVDLTGFGNVADLSQVIARDSSGRLSFLLDNFAGEADGEKRLLILDQIIFAWSGASAYSSASRGGYIDDGRKLYSVEFFLGRNFIQSSGTNEGTANPGPNAAAQLMKTYDLLAEAIYSGLMLQTHFKSLMSEVHLSFVSGKFEVDVSSLVGKLREMYNENPLLGEQLIGDFAGTLLNSGSFGISLLASLKQSGNPSSSGFDSLLANLSPMLGGAGNDEIYGDSQSNLLSGLFGRDVLYGGEGNDILDGGTGDDYLSGDAGSDIYRFSRGWGKDTLNNYDVGTGKGDYIEFDDTVAVADIVVTRSGDNLILTLKGGEDKVTVINYFYNDGVSSYYLEGVRFADGTVWGLSQIFVMVASSTPGNDEIHGYASSDTLNGGLGDDSLYGAQGNDSLIGGGGNDYLEGGTGSDTYWFNLGDGADVIYEGSENQGDLDVLRFGQGVFSGDIEVSNKGDNLILRHKNGVDQVAIINWFNSVGSRYQIERVEFLDGTSWTSAALNAMVLNKFGTDGDDVIIETELNSPHVFVGGAGNDTLTTGAGNDRLEGGTGNDVLNGGDGGDTYVFNLGDGRDVINENGNNAADVDRLVFGAGITASDISISRSGNDLVLKHVNGQDQVTISRWFSTTDTRFQVERIEFVDGTLWAREYVSASSLQLTGSEGDDVLTGVTAAFNQVLSGLGGNDTLTGGAGNDRLEGGTGNDVLAGGNGGDIYVFNLGDGRDVINENGDSSADVDRLVFGAGISASDISISRSGNDLVLKHVNGQDQVTISRWFSTTDTRFQVERIEFVDGTVWARTDVSAPLLQMTGSEGDDVLTGVTAAFNQVLSGLGGNDTLTGGAGNDRLEGGKGNDILAGGNGGDTYVFNLGDGRDVINENGDSSADVDRLVFGIGIAASDITISRTGNDLILSHSNGSDQIRISNWFATADVRYQIERIEFADGTLWTSTSLTSPLLELTGGDGDDILTGVTSAVPQIIRGGGGNDVLTGGAGKDLLEGGKGNDVLTGGNGGDTYVFNLGDGRDVINENGDSSADVDRLVFGAGITASDISISRSGNDLVLKHVNGQDQVTISRWFSTTDTRFQVERIEFVDGTVWARTDVSAPLLQMTGSEGDDVLTGVTAAFNQVLSGLGGNDTLTGGAGNDRLEGGKGNDILAGGNGGDTYVFNLGDGRDVINENGDSSADVDRLVFGIGIAASDITISRTGNDLILSHSNGSDQIRISNWFATADVRYQIERIEFADGTLWTSTSLTSPLLELTGGDGDDILTGVTSAVPQIIRGGGGNDVLTGGAGKDLLEGGKGNDVLTGGNGGDTYVFNLGDGRDVINENGDSSADVDRLVFGAGITASDISISRSGNDLVLKHVNGQDQVTISRWFSTTDTRFQVERIEFVDGTVWARTDVSAPLLQMTGSEGDDVLTGVTAAFNQVLSGLGGNDTLTGGAGNDRLEGGKGNDILAGGNGGDTYVFNLGDGRDVINENGDSSADVDRLVFGAGIAASDISISRSGNDLVLKHVNGQDQVTISRWFSTTDTRFQVERIEFVDGTLWAREYVSASSLQLTGSEGDDVLTGVTAAFNQLLSGLGGNDTLTGGAGNDRLEGGKGNDVLAGGNGGDIYVFNLGDGRDVINENGDSSADVDRLVFGAGITASDISISRSGNDLVLKHVNGQDQVTISRWFSSTDTRFQVERIEFVDGTVWARTDVSAPLLQMTGSEGDDVLTGVTAAFNQVLSGLGGNDTLTGGAGNDRLEGGKGNDILAGGNGGDTYVFNLGDGRDVINENGDSSADVDRLVFGGGIASSDISISRSGNDLVLNHGNGDDRVTVNNWFLSTSARYRIERLEFADGFVWTSDQVTSQASTNGNDSLLGSSGNDRLQGGKGNDYLQGTEGNDVYIFSAGDGQDIINNASTSPGDVDVLRFDGLTPQNLWLSRENDNLVIDALGSDERVTISDWYKSPAQQLDVIQAGSVALYASAVDNLVSAMASFGAPAGGEVNLTQAQRDQINLVIATNWQ